jgi:hypothetical protein
MVIILGAMSEVRNFPDQVGQVQLPSKGCYDIHDSVDMLLCCGCSCLWPEEKDKRYDCPSQSQFWRLVQPPFFQGIKKRGTLLR